VIVLLMIEALDCYTTESKAAHARFGSEMIAFIARNRWFWIPPLYVLALLLVVIVTHTRGADAAQFMYRNF
jgi:hypothetical protein